MEKKIKQLLVTLKEIQKIAPDFPLQYVVCLAEISLAEGLSLTELSTKTGMPLSTVSRIVGALSEKRQKGTAFGLVEVTVNAQERRRKEIYLTPQGQMLVKNIRSAMSENSFERLRL